MPHDWNRSLSCVSHEVIITTLPASVGGAAGQAVNSPALCCPVTSQGRQPGLRLPVLIAASSWSPRHIWLLVFDAWYPQRNYGIGYNYACSDIIGLDINILATCEESLFLFTVYHLAALHPFLAETVKSTIQARSETGVGSEALNKQLLKSHVSVCDGASMPGITARGSSCVPGLYCFLSLLSAWAGAQSGQLRPS